MVVGERGGEDLAVAHLHLLHQRQPEALHAAALDLPLHGLRVDRAPDVLRDGQLDHAREAELRVDVDHRAVGGEGEGEVGVALPALVQRLRRRVVVLAVASTGPSASSATRSSSPVRAARAASSSRTASHASFTAPPVMYVWREAEEEPAVPIVVSGASTSTRSTPSSVRAICACTPATPWPTSLAALWTSATGSPARSDSRTRAVAKSSKPSE